MNTVTISLRDGQDLVFPIVRKNDKDGIEGSQVKQLLNAAKIVRNGNAFELGNMLPNFETQLSNSGWLGCKQADIAARLAGTKTVYDQTNKLIAKVANEPVPAIIPVNANAKLTIIQRGKALGGGCYRQGYDADNEFVIKRGDKSHNRLEAERYNNCPKHLQACLAPCWLMPNGDLLMVKVERYQNTLAARDHGACKGKQEALDKGLSEDWIKLLNETSDFFELEDCRIGGRRGAQGGWLNGRFVFTDYAM